QGFDVALRIAAMADSSLRSRRLAPVRVMLVGSPGYFGRHGRPAHPRDLDGHKALVYSNSANPGVWRFEHPREGTYALAMDSAIRVNNADILGPLLEAGVGLALQPDFLVWRDIAAGRLQTALGDWRGPEATLQLVTPPSP